MECFDILSKRHPSPPHVFSLGRGGQAQTCEVTAHFYRIYQHRGGGSCNSACFTEKCLGFSQKCKRNEMKDQRAPLRCFQDCHNRELCQDDGLQTATSAEQVIGLRGGMSCVTSRAYSFLRFSKTTLRTRVAKCLNVEMSQICQ